VLNRTPGLPTSVLPLGNENLVARFCQIRRSSRELAEVIVAGHLRKLDLAQANGRVFSVMAGAGFDGEVVHRVHERRRGPVTKLSYALSIAGALRDYSYPEIDVAIEESGERLRGSLVFVFNLPQYAMNLPLARGARADDGWLDLCVFKRPGSWNLARYLIEVLRGRHLRPGDHQHRRVRRVRLSSPGRVCLQLDGDPAGRLDATIEVAPAALTLVAPADPTPLAQDDGRD
jgi:diacylglycerol kinase family enzyme